MANPIKEKAKMKFGLNKKMITVGALVILVSFVVLLLSNRAITQLSEDIELSKKTSQLEQLFKLINEQSIQYGENAPRDYESYNRDLKVYYTQLQENLNTASQLINETSHSYFNRNRSTNFLIDGMLIENNNKAFKQMLQRHQEFESGFNEEIGDDKENPRLEWGNNYIVSDQSGLFSQVSTTHMVFEDLVAAEQDATVRFNWLTIGVIAVMILLMFIWFNQTIVKRIIKVAAACREVTLGNYGLKVKDKSQDEIGQLVEDFNQLSSRSKSILVILDQLQTAPTKQHALDVIRTETQSIVNTSNAYFLSPQKDTFMVTLVSSNQPQKGLINKALVSNDSTIDHISNLSHISISDVLSHTITNKNAHFAKYLLNQVNANSILVLKLTMAGNTGLLLLTKNSKTEFSDEQIATLESLSSLFADALLDQS